MAIIMYYLCLNIIGQIYKSIMNNSGGKSWDYNKNSGYDPHRNSYYNSYQYSYRNNNMYIEHTNKLISHAYAFFYYFFMLLLIVGIISLFIPIFMDIYNGLCLFLDEFKKKMKDLYKYIMDYRENMKKEYNTKVVNEINRMKKQLERFREIKKDELLELEDIFYDEEIRINKYGNLIKYIFPSTSLSYETFTTASAICDYYNDMAIYFNTGYRLVYDGTYKTGNYHLLKVKNIKSVKGDHDFYVIRDLNKFGFNSDFMSKFEDTYVLIEHQGSNAIEKLRSELYNLKTRYCYKSNSYDSKLSRTFLQSDFYGKMGKCYMRNNTIADLHLHGYKKECCSVDTYLYDEDYSITLMDFIIDTNKDRRKNMSKDKYILVDFKGK